MTEVIEDITSRITAEEASAPDKHILEQNVKTVIRYLPRHEAAGPDGLWAELFKAGTPLWAKIIAQIMNAMLNRTDKIPECLTSSIILLLYKKGSLEHVENYRPIELVNVVSKIMSEVYCNRLKPLLPKNIPIEQTGFIQGRHEKKSHDTRCDTLEQKALLTRYTAQP